MILWRLKSRQREAQNPPAWVTSCSQFLSVLQLIAQRATVPMSPFGMNNFYFTEWEGVYKLSNRSAMRCTMGPRFLSIKCSTSSSIVSKQSGQISHTTILSIIFPLDQMISEEKTAPRSVQERDMVRSTHGFITYPVRPRIVDFYCVLGSRSSCHRSAVCGWTSPGATCDSRWKQRHAEESRSSLSEQGCSGDQTPHDRNRPIGGC